MNVQQTPTVVVAANNGGVIVQNDARARTQLIILFTFGGVFIVIGIPVLLFVSIAIGVILMAVGVGMLIGGSIRCCMVRQNQQTVMAGVTQQPYTTGANMQVATTHQQTTVLQAPQPQMTTNYHQPGQPEPAKSYPPPGNYPPSPNMQGAQGYGPTPPAYGQQ